MGPIAVLLASVVGVPAPFRTNVKVNQQNTPDRHCYSPGVVVGPGASVQPLYIVFQDDSFPPGDPTRIDVTFQKSTDGGATWLSEDKIIRRGDQFAEYPDLTVDPGGNLYIAYLECPPGSSMNYGHIYCVGSTDAGSTWSAPVKVDDHADSVGTDVPHITADAAGSLFCAWPDRRNNMDARVFSSVSTDHGATWSPNVRVDDDTVSARCFAEDVCAQPGTNHYLVTATCPYRPAPGNISSHAYLYRSTNMGQSFQPGVQLDTFSYLGSSSVVADAQHVICDYTGNNGQNNLFTQARTLYTPADTWGSRSSVTDTAYSSYYSCGLALSADGRVHTALNIQYPGHSDVCYSFSTDHGSSWSETERVNDDTLAYRQDPAIAADSAGYVYVVWGDARGGADDIWFSTNSPAGIAEEPTEPSVGAQPSATVVRNFLLLPEGTNPRPQAASSLLDIGGRQVMVLKPGANDVRALAPGVYFIREGLGIRGEGPGKTQKVVLTE